MPRLGLLRNAARWFAVVGAATVALAPLACGSKSNGGGGGVTGPEAFLGTWTPMGQEAGLSVASEKCGTGIEETEAVTSTLTLVQGPASNTIALTTSSGCTITFAVTGNTATAASGQTCTSADDAGETSVEAVDSYMLIANGGTLTSTLTGTITNTKAGKTEMCSVSAEAEYTKG
jgi:hypothetical protein